MELVLDMTAAARIEAAGRDRDILVIGCGWGMQQLVEQNNFDCHQMNPHDTSEQNNFARDIADRGVFAEYASHKVTAFVLKDNGAEPGCPPTTASLGSVVPTGQSAADSPIRVLCTIHPSHNNLAVSVCACPV